MSNTFRSHDLVLILMQSGASVILRGEAAPFNFQTAIRVSAERESIGYGTLPLSKEHSLLLPKEFLS